MAGVNTNAGLILASLIPIVALTLGFLARAGRSRVAKWRALVRAPADLRPGIALLNVTVRAERGEFVPLGASDEYGESTYAPTLETTAFIVRDDGGNEFSVPARARLAIVALANARRKHLASVTSATGIVHRYSFEVSPETTFELLATLPAWPQLDHPFRGSRSIALAPVGDSFHAGTLTPSYTFGSLIVPGLFIGAALGGGMIGPFGVLFVDVSVWWFAAIGAVIGPAVLEATGLPTGPPIHA